MPDPAELYPPAGPILTYDGRIGELYRIFLVNILLSIVTLGIWRFWATTRLRRYLWSHTRSGGERFEYDGTGGQLFVGFLLAGLILLGMAGGSFVLGFLLAMVSRPLAVLPIFLFYLAVIVLALGAPFSAQRYRLNHTLWRGIRGGMEGSMIVYGLFSLLYSLAVTVTLTQLLPWASLRLTERRANASSMGTLRFTLQAPAMPLYLRYLLTFIGIVALAVPVFGIFAFVERAYLGLLLHGSGQAVRQFAMGHIALGLVVAYVVFLLGVALISAGYSAAFYRHVTQHAALGPLRFGSAVTGWAVLRLVGINILILVCTFGLGLPVIVQRNMVFFATNLLASGTIDPATLGQSTQAASRFGEGMFQALDAGAGFG